MDMVALVGPTRILLALMSTVAVLLGLVLFLARLSTMAVLLGLAALAGSALFLEALATFFSLVRPLHEASLFSMVEFLFLQVLLLGLSCA